MGMTIKEGMQRIKREFAFGGVEAALNELDDIKYHGFGVLKLKHSSLSGIKSLN